MRIQVLESRDRPVERNRLGVVIFRGAVMRESRDRDHQAMNG
jgi:hypothetical protein